MKSVIFLFVIVLLLSACAMHLNVESTIPEIDESPAFDTSIRISEVKGLAIGNAVNGVRLIKSANYRQAIMQTFQRNGLFTKIGVENAKYLLDVQFTRHIEPFGGAQMSCYLDCEYKLIRVADLEVVWEKTICETGTGKFSDSLIATTRGRLAVERAVQNQMKALVAGLSELKGKI